MVLRGVTITPLLAPKHILTVSPPAWDLLRQAQPAVAARRAVSVSLPVWAGASGWKKV